MRSDLTARRSPSPTEQITDFRTTPFASSLGPDDLQITDYVRIIHKRWWLIVLLIATGVGAAALKNWMTVPVYEAMAIVHLEADTNVLALDRPLTDTRDWMGDFMPTQLGILTSREVAKNAYAELKASSNGLPVQNGAPLTVGDIAAGRTVGRIRDTRLVNVGFQSTDPQTAKEVANALASVYTRFNVGLKSRATSEASDFLAEQVERQRQMVKASEDVLLQYRQQHGAEALLTDRIGTERQNVIVQKWAELQQAASQARADTIGKAADYNQLQAVMANHQPLETISAIAANPNTQRLTAELTGLQRQLAQASNELGERHPEYIKLLEAARTTEQKLQAELTTIAQGIRNDYEAAKSREHGLLEAVERQKREVQALNAKGVEYTTLEREAATNRDVLDKLLQRAREANLARDLQNSSVRVIDWADLPGAPILPRKQRNLLLGFVGSAMLALALVFGLEIFNTRLTSPDDLKRHLGIAVLGVAPEVKRRRSAGAPMAVRLPTTSPFTELLHGLRTNLMLAPELGAAHTLLVTSAEPGEGKTAMAANIAVSFARTNPRVLLVDADLRKPRLHHVCQTEQQPGLTDLLKEPNTEGVFRKTKIAGLWFLPSGNITRNPADLLGSIQFQELVARLGEEFDWVIVDSPPVLAVTDASLIAQATAGVLFVVGSGRTSRAVAAAGLERLNTAGAKVIGALLNRAELNGRGTSYLPYYRQSYDSYYVQRDENWSADAPSSSAAPSNTRPPDVPPAGS